MGSCIYTSVIRAVLAELQAGVIGQSKHGWNESCRFISTPLLLEFEFLLLSLSLSLAWTEISPHSLACWNLYTSFHPMNLVFCFIESYVFKYVAFQATCLVVVLSIDDPEPPGICSWGQCTRTGHMLTLLQHFTMLCFRWRRQYMYDIISLFSSQHKHMMRTLRLDPRVFNLFRFWSRISL